MEAPTAPAERPQRADARRNRERIIAAARTAFAEAGVHAQMEDVARRAGVGWAPCTGTSPRKEALIGELLAQKFRLLLEGAREALDVEDPWEAFAGTLRRNAELMAADAAVQDALMRVEADWSYAEGGSRRAKATFAITIDRAKAAGVIRDDFTIDRRTHAHVRPVEHDGGRSSRRHVRLAPPSRADARRDPRRRPPSARLDSPGGRPKARLPRPRRRRRQDRSVARPPAQARRGRARSGCAGALPRGNRHAG